MMLQVHIYISVLWQGKSTFSSIGNPTLFHVSLATSVYQCPRWLCFQTFNAKARILLSLENMFKSYIQKDKQLLKWWSRAIQKPFIPMLSKGLQKPFIPMFSKASQHFKKEISLDLLKGVKFIPLKASSKAFSKAYPSWPPVDSLLKIIISSFILLC